MDYRIFNLCAWSFLCVHTHGGWAHQRWISTKYLTRKNLSNPNWSEYECKRVKFFLCSWRTKLRSWNAKSDALPTEPPRHPGSPDPIMFKLNWATPNFPQNTPQSLLKPNNVLCNVWYMIRSAAIHPDVGIVLTHLLVSSTVIPATQTGLFTTVPQPHVILMFET